VLDSANPAAARAALQGAGLVVAMTSFKDAQVDNADVLLPIAPFTETAGTFVNAEGRVQGFHGVVPPLGDTRPGWKVLRVLGNMLGLSGFEQETSEDVLREALGDGSSIAGRLSNRAVSSGAAHTAGAPSGLQRIADVPIYCTDALVRRAEALQLTSDARPPVVSLPSALWRQLGLGAGALVQVRQGEAQAQLPAIEDPTLDANVVRVPAGHAHTSMLGPMFGALSVEKA
jgi:NADH-quinone oxidoreductase subunit G